MNILKNCLISEALAPVSASSSIDSNSAILDMAGYEGVVFIVPIEDSVTGGVATLTIQHNTANSDSGMAATDSVATVTCVSSDDINQQLLVAELYKPTKRYVQGVVTSSAANIAFGTMIAIRYGPRKAPVTEDTTVSDSDLATG